MMLVVEADHSEALQLLLRYPAPTAPDSPATLVQDAIFLDRNRTQQGGSDLISRRSGRRPRPVAADRGSPSRRPPALQLNQRRRDQNMSPSMRSAASPGLSAARFLSPQKNLESLFQEVSGNLQKRTEGWNMGKTLREAVRRNMSGLQSTEDSPRTSLEGTAALSVEPIVSNETEGLKRKLVLFERRNQALAKMMNEALEELRGLQQRSEPSERNPTEENLNVTLAKLQFVQVYLADSDIPIPTTKPRDRTKVPTSSDMPQSDKSGEQVKSAASKQEHNKVLPVPGKEESLGTKTLLVPDRSQPAGKGESPKPSLTSPQPRPALAQSPLSWMLGDGKHRSDFVTSASPPPEERRDSIPHARPKRLFPDGSDDKGNNADSEDDGFTMNSLRGRRG